MFSRKDLLHIIAPLVLEQMLAITVGLCDTMMVSSVGEAAVSGISLVDSLNLLLIFVFGAMATGGTVIAAQLIGRRDEKAACAAAKQMVYVVFFVSLAVTAVTLIFRERLLYLLFGSIEADVMQHAQTYLFWTALSFPPLALYNAGTAIFRSVGNTKLTLYTALFINAVNIVGNAILIYGFGLGVAGAAIATLFSRTFGGVLMIALAHRKKYPIHLENIFSYRPEWRYIRGILRIGVPAGLENCMFQVGKLMTQSLISTFSPAAVTANAVAGTLTALQYTPGNAMAAAATTITGQCIGAGEKEQAKKYTKILTVITYISIIAVSVLILACSGLLIGLFHMEADSAAIAKQLLVIHSVIVCTVWTPAFLLPSSFRAANDIRFPLIVSLATMWILRVGGSYVLGNGLSLGVAGVWLAMGVDWTVRACIFSVRYFRGKWLTKYRPD